MANPYPWGSAGLYLTGMTVLLCSVAWLSGSLRVTGAVIGGLVVLAARARRSSGEPGGGWIERRTSILIRVCLTVAGSALMLIGVAWETNLQLKIGLLLFVAGNGVGAFERRPSRDAPDSSPTSS